MSLSRAEPSQTKTAVVTFLDVLGWKGIWQRKENAIKELENLVDEMLQFIPKHERGTGKTGDETSIMIVSDTIVVNTPCTLENASTKIEFHGEICKVAIPSSIKKGIPLRGATSFGDVAISAKNNIFAGKAIDEAAAWHEQGDWIGVFMTPSAMFLFDTDKSACWIKHNPPLKNKTTLNTYSCVWYDKNHPEAYLKEIKKDFTLLAPIVPEIVNKFMNTIDFIELEFSMNSGRLG